VRHAPREQPARDPADAFRAWNAPDDTHWLLFFRSARGYLLRFPGLADFELSADGSHVDAWPAPGASAEMFDHLYLNQVVPLAISRQGKLVLHAAAVEIDGGAAVFAAPTGRGKSTLAASFALDGHRFLTDDGLQLEWNDNNGLMATPSHPSVRLLRDSQNALLGDRMPIESARDHRDKARILAGPALPFCDQPRRVRAIYFLGAETPAVPAIVRLQPARALMALVSHSFLLDIEEREMLATHFAEISRIAQLPLHYDLNYSRHFDGLPQVRQAVTEHLRSLEAP
jgi:hypothetical protein